MKKTKRYEDGGYLLDSEGKRVKSGSGDDIQTGSYNKEADMESARKKLAGEVQESPGQSNAKTKRSDDVAPKSKASTPAVSSSYRSEGANKAKPSTSSGSAASTAPAKKSGSSFSALPMNPSLLRQRDEAEKKRDAARAARRSADEAEEKARPAKEAAQRKMLSEQPGAVAYRKKREEQDKMSPGQRSAARGKALKEFFGMKKGGSINGIAKRGLTRCKTV